MSGIHTNTGKQPKVILQTTPYDSQDKPKRTPKRRGRRKYLATVGRKPQDAIMTLIKLVLDINRQVRS